MAWTTPMTAVANTGLTAAQWNASVRDNLLETAVAKATTSGSYPVSTGANALAERHIEFDSIATNETTASTSFTNLATTGPTVNVTSGARCIGMHSSYLDNTNVNAACLVALDISGDTTHSPIDNLALSMTSSTAGAHLRATYVVVYSMTPGNSVFTMQYRVSAGTGTFKERRLTVQPF